MSTALYTVQAYLVQSVHDLEFYLILNTSIWLSVSIEITRWIYRVFNSSWTSACNHRETVDSALAPLTCGSSNERRPAAALLKQTLGMHCLISWVRSSSWEKWVSAWLHVVQFCVQRFAAFPNNMERAGERLLYNVLVLYCIVYIAVKLCIARVKNSLNLIKKYM